MDVAITGASGFIGRALTSALEAEGHRVAPLVRSGAGGAASGDRQPNAIAWSPERGTIDAAGLEGIDAVVHLAGEGIAERRWSTEQKRRILESRTAGTSLIASTLAELRKPPRVLLSASAIGFYGDRGDTVLTEESAPGDGFLAEVCLAWEAATRPAEEAGIRVAHLRTGIVLSRRGGALAKMLPLFRLGLGGRFGRGQQRWSWITLADHVAATRVLLDAAIEGPVNLTAPEPVTNAHFTRALGAAVHRPTLLPVPEIGPALLLGRELAHHLLYASADVRPARLTSAGFTFMHRDIDAALRAVLDERD